MKTWTSNLSEVTKAIERSGFVLATWPWRIIHWFLFPSPLGLCYACKPFLPTFPIMSLAWQSWLLSFTATEPWFFFVKHFQAWPLLLPGFPSLTPAPAGFPQFSEPYCNWPGFAVPSFKLLAPHFYFSPLAVHHFPDMPSGTGPTLSAALHGQ